MYNKQRITKPFIPRSDEVSTLSNMSQSTSSLSSNSIDSEFITSIPMGRDNNNNNDVFNTNNNNDEYKVSPLNQVTCRDENKALKEEIIKLKENRLEIIDCYTNHIEQMENSFKSKTARLRQKVKKEQNKRQMEQALFTEIICERDETIDNLQLAISKLEKKLEIYQLYQNINDQIDDSDWFSCYDNGDNDGIDHDFDDVHGDGHHATTYFNVNPK